MKHFFTLSFLILLTGITFSQNYQGPAIGNLASGVVQTTETLEKGPANIKPFVFERPEVKLIPTNPYFPKPTPPEGSNYQEDRSGFRNVLANEDTLLVSFKGIDMGNSIPPDPTLAVGPNHVIACVNTNFKIWDKEGNLLRTLEGPGWISKSVTNADVVTDPKVSFDHYSKRFIMVWMTVNTAAQTSYWVISVSKDSSALGTWYSWAMPSNVNGNTPSYNYSDYQGVGFDKDAVYITGNQFGFVGGFQYSKLRIIPKAQLLNNTPNAITWTDFWDIRMPEGANTQTFGIRPTIHFSESSAAYMVWAYPFGTASFISLYKIANPISQNPTITGVNLPTTAFSVAPDANQLGGYVTYPINTGGSNIRTEAIFRDGNIWAVHAVRNPAATINTAALHYIKADVNTNQVLEDVVYGKDSTWYFYPTIMADKDKNIHLGFSRSSLSDYAGAFYASRKVNDTELGPSRPLQTGKGNYEVVFGGTRNRWGDYMGIALDPSDEYSMWTHTEYASQTNKWGTWIGKVLVRPIPGPFLTTQQAGIDFGAIPVGQKDTSFVTLVNYGAQDVVITNIPSAGAFKVVKTFNFPVTLSTYDSVTFKVTYEPAVQGNNSEIISIVSNAANLKGIKVQGSAFILNPTAVNKLYASTGTNQNGEVYSLSTTNGTATLVGSTSFPEVKALAVHPRTKIMYGSATVLGAANILGVDGTTGQAYKLITMPNIDIKAMAFDTTGKLYAATQSGEMFTVDLATKKYTKLFNAKSSIISMSFNPKNNDLWAVSVTVLGTKDKLFKIKIANGDTVNMGRTGTTLNSNAISFDYLGNLYIATGAVTAANNLYKVDTLTNTSALLGSTGIKHITDMTFSTPVVSGVEDDVQNPVEFALSQNYPNPFNPSTVIEYALPKYANVRITVYNVLGQRIKELVNAFNEAGTYQVKWNASGVTSGIYFYEMKAVSPDGSEFSSFRKMMLVK